jgi:hypothetical protein
VWVGERSWSVPLAAAIACSPQAASSGAGSTGAEPTLAVVLPVRNAGAGRQAFIDSKCTACRAVASEPESPKPISANPGPSLGRAMAKRDPSCLAAPIMNHHLRWARVGIRTGLGLLNPR